MRFQDILTSALDKTMYEKVHHNLKKKSAHQGELAWREIPFQKLKSRNKRWV